MSALAGISMGHHHPSNERGLLYKGRKSPIGRVLNTVGQLFQSDLPYDLADIPERKYQACTAIIRLSKQQQLNFTSVLVIHEIIKKMFPAVNIVMITDFFKESFTSNKPQVGTKETLTIIPMIAENHFTLLARINNMVLYFNSVIGTSLENQSHVQLDRNSSRHDIAMPEIKTIGDVFNHYTKDLDIHFADVPNQAPTYDLLQEDYTSCGVYGMTFVYKLCCKITETDPKKDQGKGLTTFSNNEGTMSSRAPRRFWITAITDLSSPKSCSNQKSKKA
jgi:hypothetical protein